MNPPPDNDPQGGPPNKNSRIGRREIAAILLHDEAVQPLADHSERPESLAEALFRAETLEGPEAFATAEMRPARGATPTAEPTTVAAS
jgi:hypothetical protein